MEYVKVENGQVTERGLPTVGTLKDGSVVSGYNLLDPLILFEEGWRTLEDTQPEYDSSTEYIDFEGYTVDEYVVIANYEVKPIVIVPTAPSQEERLQALEAATLALMEVLGSV